MNRPFVSIIMPIRNEADRIARSLGAVLSQDYPPEQIEVLIVDGMSSDDTRAEITRTMAAQPHILVKVLDNPGRIVPMGMNIALAQARGEIVVRVDGHCEIALDYVSRCVEHLLTGGIQGVGGPIETIGLTPISQIIAAAMSSAFGVGGSAFRTVRDKDMLVDTVAFPAYTRQAILEAGPYDEELVRNQDDEYNYRLRALGFKILLASDIRARYYSRGSLRALWRQYFQYGYWKVRVMQKHPRQMRMRQFAPPLFVATAAGGAVLAPFFAPVLWLWLGVLSLYAALNLALSFRLASQKGWLYMRWLPVVFVTLHIGYGLGFLVGLVKFAGRWGSRTGKRA